MHDLISRAGVIEVPCLSTSAQRLVVYLGILEKSCFLSRYLSWEIILFSLTYPWKLSAVNLPREMAVTHGLVFYHGKRLCYHGK